MFCVFLGMQTRLSHCSQEPVIDFIASAFDAMRSELGDEFVRVAALTMLNEQIAFNALSRVLPLLARLACESGAVASGLAKRVLEFFCSRVWVC